MADEDDDFDDTPPKASLLKRAALGLGLLGLMLGMGLLISSYLGPTGKTKPGPQQIALIKQPPPPPPKPPERMPEPPKIKEEVKIDQPKPEPQPDEPKQADEKPASDKPLGVDAAGAAGSDGFGLVGSTGGRDLLATGGGGSSGAYYSGLLQRQFFDAMSRNRKVLKEEFRVVVKIWLGDDGRVQRSEIVSGSGSPGVDQLIQTTLAEMSPLREVPPASMRPMQLRLSNRS